MNEENILLDNIDKIHTTEMGVVRIRKNLQLKDTDVIEWCCKQISRQDSTIYRQGKNWYVEVDDSIITINAYSYTVITAHKKK